MTISIFNASPARYSARAAACAVLCAALMAAAAAATPARERGAIRTEADIAAPPPLEAARRLKISVQYFEQLTGVFHIDPALRVTFPALGRLSVAGHDVESFERALEARVAAFTERPTRVTVEVAEYEPVLVTGAVATPGSYAWSPGLTPLAAATLAGGAQRAAIDPFRGDLSRDRMMLSVALSRLKTALARRARLEAQRAGADRLTPPEALSRLVGAREAARLIQAEQRFLDNEAQALALRRAADASASRASAAETANLDVLVQSLSAQAERRAAFSGELERLKKRGVVSEARLMEASAQAAQVEERLAGARVAKIQLEARAVDLERERVQLESDRLVRIDLELASLRGEIEQAAAQYETAAAALDEIGAPRRGDGSGALAYAVARRAGQARGLSTAPMVLTQTEAFSALSPGDVLVVCPRFDETWPITPEGGCRRPPLGQTLLGLR
ncbi:MAG: polysaccharide biosynthesis/export family protein [Pseudomonadota bacterium]